MAKGREASGPTIKMEVVEQHVSVARINVTIRVSESDLIDGRRCKGCELKRGKAAINKCSRTHLVTVNGSSEQQFIVSVDKESIPGKTGCGVLGRFPEIFKGKNTVGRRKSIRVGGAVETARLLD